MIKLYPIQFEGYEDGDGVFNITAQDGHCAEIKITAWQNADSWPETSAAIQQALDMMKLGEDE